MGSASKRTPTASSNRDLIERGIYVVHGENVMFDFDLAALYEVKTKALVQAVKRNSDRFPEDFMFRLTQREFENWRSQIVTSNPAMRMGLRRPPFAFTEQGVAMLSSVLRSPNAVEVNIQIMRTFVRMRGLMLTHRDLAAKLTELERRYDKQFAVVFEAIRHLMKQPRETRRSIGFRHQG